MMETIPQLEQTLLQTINPDISIRNSAEMKIQEYKKTHLYAFLISLLKIFIEDPQMKQLAGAFLRNTMCGRDITILNQISKRWQTLTEPQAKIIKTQVISLLNTEDNYTREIMSNVTSGIIIAEHQFNEHYFLKCLIEEFGKTETLNAGIFKAIAILIDFIGLDIIKNNLDIIKIYMMLLTPIKYEADCHLKCFKMCIPLINRDYENFYHFLIGYIQANTKLVIECITEFIKQFYDLYKDLDNIIIAVTQYLMSDFDLEVVDFWISMTDIVISQKKLGKKILLGKILEVRFPQILPVLLIKLKSEDDEDWNIHRATSCLLQKIAEISDGDLLKNRDLQTFVAENILDEAGVVAFSSSICKVSEEAKFLEFVVNSVVTNISNVLVAENSLKNPENAQNQNFPPNLKRILENLDTDKLCLLKEKNIWALSQICKYSFNSINKQILVELINLSKGLFTVSINACLLIKNIFESQKEDSSLLVNFYSDLLNVMIDGIEKIPLTQFEQRNALFACLSGGITACPPGFMKYLDDFLNYIIPKMEGYTNELVNPSNNSQNGFFVEDLLISYIQLTQTIIESRNETFVPLSLKSKLKNIFQNILQLKTKSLAGTEVYITVSFLCTEQSYFLANIEKFMYIAYSDLQNALCHCKTMDGKCLFCQGFGTDQTTYKAALKFVGNIANLMDRGFIKYLELVPVIIQGFISHSVSLNVKPMIISTLSDICVSVGSSYSEYLQITMTMISQIYEINRISNIKYVDELRNNVCLLISALLLNSAEEPIMLENEDHLLKMLWFTFHEDSYNVCLFNLIKCLSDFIRKRNKCEVWGKGLIERGRHVSNDVGEMGEAVIELVELYSKVMVYDGGNYYQ
ncbi:Importin subunit beta [Cucumispora dikerogammari]|nr:Importin subunit beta [Cucumispora dikerogammari]